MRLFFIFQIIILNFLFLSSAGQPKSLINSYFKAAFSGNYPKAEKILNTLKINWPESNKTALIAANYYGALYETSGGQDKYYFVCKKYTDKVINEDIKKTPNNDYVFRMISAKSILLKIDVLKKNYWKVAKNMQSVIPLFEYAIDKEKEDDKMKFISGMYNYYVETAKDDYPVAYPILIFYPSGDKQKGLKLLKECSKSEDLNISVRSLLQLALIYYRDEKNIDYAKYYFIKLLSVYPENMIWQTEYLNALKKYNKLNDYEKRKQIIKTKLENNIYLNSEQKAYFYKKAEIKVFE